MSEETNQPLDATEAPPPADMESSSSRRKRSRKGTIIATGALVVFLGGAWLILFGGGDSDSAPTLDGQEISSSGSPQQSSTTIESNVQQGGMGGGVRQEVASVQSNIEDEERRQERLETGRSVITFGETLIEEEDAPQEDAASEQNNSTFGEIAPEPTRPEAKEEFPVNPGRQQVRIAGSSGSANATAANNAGTMSAAINQEIQRYNADREGQTQEKKEEVYYAAPVVKKRPASTRDDADESLKASHAFTQGELAMPGDTVAAYMENRITSDQPSGRVVATILEGPMEGARAIGEASFEGDRLLIAFNRVVTRQGDLIDGIEALAVDPNTMETSLQSGVDRKLFQRYGVPLLYGIAAIGLDYASEKGSTTVYEQDLETGESVKRSVREGNRSFGDYMTDNASDVLDKPLGRAANEAASVEPTAWANPGVIGLLFDTAVPSRE